MFNLVDLTKFIILLTIIPRHAPVDYCDFGICDPEQYCCGDNKCCEKTVDLWYFWIGIIIILIAIFLVVLIKCLRKCRTVQDRYNGYTSLLVPNIIEKS